MTDIIKEEREEEREYKVERVRKKLEHRNKEMDE